MRKILFILSLLTSIGYASAQSEIPSDSIRRPLSNVKEFNGFLLDMGLMNVAPPKLPSYSLDVPDLSKDYNRIFRLNNDITYTQGFTDSFTSPYGFGNFWGLPGNSQFMQMGSFKLKNGWSMNTYGDYDKEGWKVPNRSAMPWQKNDFRGAFELKSPNGSFGIRIEVQQQRKGLY